MHTITDEFYAGYTTNKLMDHACVYFVMEILR